MLTTILLSGIALLFYTSCSKQEAHCPKTGTVIGQDYSLCLCCGGWFVDYGGETLRFYSIPDENTLLEWADKYGYPVHIEFDFIDSEGACSNFHKTMTCMKIRKHNDCTLSGHIIDYRSEECLCCPGWIIVTGTDTIKAEVLPNDPYVHEIFNGLPITIRFDYENTEGTCEAVYKKITCIEIIDY